MSRHTIRWGASRAMPTKRSETGRDRRGPRPTPKRSDAAAAGSVERERLGSKGPVPGQCAAGVVRRSEAQIRPLDALITKQILSATLHDQAPGLQHVAVLREREGEHRVLLHQNDGHVERIDLP